MTKKVVCMCLLAIALLSIALPASAGTIETPNGGRAILWRLSTSSGSDYVAYVSSGSDATLLNSTSSNNRYNVNAYGYNSREVYGYYKGWVNTAYYHN